MVTRLAALTLLLAGCDPQLEADLPVDDAHGAGQVPPPAPPRPILSDPVRGEDVVLSVWGMPAGATVWFVVGSSAGAGPCPPALGGACLGVTDAQPAGPARANPHGVASFTLHLPDTTPPGATLAVQAVTLGGQVGLSAVTEVAVVDLQDVCDPTARAWWSGADAAEECSMHLLVNQTRARGQDCGNRGWFDPQPPLVLDDRLQTAARVHAEWMRTTGSFTHQSPGGPLGDTFDDRMTTVGYAPVSAGENILKGRLLSADAIARWLGSSPHCANLMTPDHEDVGFGRSTGAGRAHWVAITARHR